MTIAQEGRSRQGELLAGRYTLLERLGGGGVGEVYKARDARLKRDVAIKLLRHEHTRSRDVVERLLREAQVTDQVRHPNVVEVFDVDIDPSGIPFIVQELLRGRDLADHLSRHEGKLPVEEVLGYMISVCDAVSAAHFAKVVHRDLKPENVFLMQTAMGLIPKVLDFGLARVLLVPGQARLTVTGLTMGTPYFMSPEQVQGDRNIDARTDVWALGVMLYELLTGSLPFHGDSEGAVYVKVCTVEPTPVEMLAPWISPELARVVGRCLRKDAARRYPDASGVLRDLTHVQQREPIEPTLVRGIASTQLMKMQPVALALPTPSLSPSLHPTSINPAVHPLGVNSQRVPGPVVNLAAAQWQTGPVPPPPPPQPASWTSNPQPRVPKLWIMAAVFGASLLLVGALLGLGLLWHSGEEPEDSTDRDLGNSGQRVPRPFTPVVSPNTPLPPPVPPPPVVPPQPPLSPPPMVPPPPLVQPLSRAPSRASALSPKPPASNSVQRTPPSDPTPSSNNNTFQFPVENSGQ